MTPIRFSANTGFLFTDLPFVDRIRQAAAQGFDAVEFHDEAQREDRARLKDVLAETGMPVVGLNVRMGDSAGCAALPGAGDQARRDIDDAAVLARDIGAGAVHVLAGKTDAPEAEAQYLAALTHALEQFDGTILIEPISAEQIPGYFLRRLDQAAGIIDQIGHPRLKILFDCYHVWREEGDVRAPFARHAERIGHVQIAAAEGRAEPFPGALDYAELLPVFRGHGYAGPFGCEYRPRAGTVAGLGWRDLIPG